jgi:hypothetical protein
MEKRTNTLECNAKTREVKDLLLGETCTASQISLYKSIANGQSRRRHHILTSPFFLYAGIYRRTIKSPTPVQRYVLALSQLEQGTRDGLAIDSLSPAGPDDFKFEGFSYASGSSVYDTTSIVSNNPIGPSFTVGIDALVNSATETLHEIPMDARSNMTINNNIALEDVNKAAFDSPTLRWFSAVGMEPFAEATTAWFPNNETLHSMDISSEPLSSPITEPH